MNEIEVKILEINTQSIIQKLLALGAQKTFEGELTATQFDFDDRRLGREEKLLRLRKEGDQTKLTFKHLLNDDQTKTSNELEVGVSDFDQMQNIILAIGMKPKKGYPFTKHRTSYIIDNVHFEIDNIPGIPTYLEIEGPDEKTIIDYVIKLGYSTADAKPWGTRQVFEYYKTHQTNID